MRLPLFPVLFSLLCLAASPLAAQYAGHVFHDANGNGIKEVNESGVARVLVSNGVDVVQTNTDGAFRLPNSARDKFIFITTPAGFQATSFFQPNHGPADDYHFPLIESGLGESFSFIHISDTETTDSTRWMRMLRDYGQNMEAAFVIHTGDICYSDGMRFHADHLTTGFLGMPMYYTVGNHDLVAGDYGEQLFEELFGPVYYSFDVGNVHFIVTPMPGGDYQPRYTQADVFRWLKNDLAHVPDDKTVFVFNHDLLFSKDDFVFRLNEEEALDLKEEGLRAWVYGHWHNHVYYPHAESGVVSICTSPPNKGGIDYSIAAFRVFDVAADGSFTTRLVHSYVDHALTIAAPAPTTRLSPAGEVPILVNAYNSTAPVRSVTYQLERSGDKPLAQVSPWSWSGSAVPPGPTNGIDSLHLTVRGHFEDGQTVERERRFSVRPFRATPPGATWPNFLLNPSLNPGGTEAVYPPLELAWVSNVGSSIYHCSPVVADGKLFIASIDDGDLRNSYVYAHDLENGDILWQAPTRSSVKHALAYAEGLVISADQFGFVYAFDAETGTLRWEHDLGIGPLPTYVGGVTVSGEVVYAGDGKRFKALRIRDGAVLWTNNAWPLNMGGPAPPSVGGGVVVASSNWKHLYAFDEGSGEPLWNVADDGLGFRNAGPVYADGYFFTAARNTLFKMEPRTGEVVQKAQTGYNLNASSSPALTDELLIIGTVDAGLCAYDRASFEEVWRFEVGPGLTTSAPYATSRMPTVSATPVISGDLLYVGGQDGKFYCLKTTDGSLQWSLDLGAPIYSTVAITAGRIYLADLGGNVYAFRQKRN